MIHLLPLVIKAAQFLLKHFPHILDVKNSKDLSCTLKDNPEKSIELYKHLMTLELEMHRIVLQDRQNARLSNGSWYQRLFMLLFICGGLISCFYLIHKAMLTNEMLVIVSTLVGMLSACLKDIYAFEFGTFDLPKRDKGSYFPK